MKRLFVALLLLAACSPARRAETPSSFKVGLLTPGSINDGGWNNIAWQGLQRIRKDLGAQVSNKEVKPRGEIEDAFRSYGKTGCDLAFGNGLEFRDARS